ncbi:MULTISPECIES: tail fiber assembly protein [Tenebrionibacter/Tenebrionicola group]|jgi:hypothetical protein|uniref:Tail fiber assembly protein n=2 Tax=Tenebrionibacter/Tenebrionicola group TaxID=2969848 RepID=A0A8K0V7E7_9ENTR|nr:MULTISPECIES: tail fiber assembly protein [Tenebrionibacter/Tenebrionicola group]MBK4715540.1 tail fiber assembly protein [Tenebrionibacter intestinalis]MBV4411317.1 tail fiber assembly protein [Tenebrionicola larvae]MBV5095783.1 tail fiber assembly protein [Tenebrionicola larvae]
MQQFSKFSVYVPEDADRLALVEQYGVMFLKNADGLDWYDCRRAFAADTLKIGYDDDGRIATFTRDVDALMPVDLLVAEVPATDENMRIALGEDWFYIDGHLTQNINYIARAETKKSQLLTAAAAAIAPLQDAVELGIATDEEIALLVAWKKCRVLLNRIDTSAAPNIDWPEMPE